MLVGLSVNDHPNEVRIYGRGRSSYATIDWPLPAAVEKPVKLLQARWNTGFPVAEFGAAGHGPYDVGLVFRPCIYDSIEDPHFIKNGIKARVSYGQGSVGDEGDGRAWDPAKIGRLHLSVYGMRKFLPVEYEQLFSDIDHGKDPVKLFFENEINISLRWINGSFDDWSDIRLWENDAVERYNYMNRYMFDETRTAYARAVDLHMPVNEDRLDDLIRQLERKKNLVPKNPTVEKAFTVDKYQDSEKFEALQKVYGHCLISGWNSHIPLIGYMPVLELLQPFGGPGTDMAEKIPKMNMEEGAAFLFEQVLPAVENFSRA
ncbi:MAG: hypothetical protein HY513_04555 [Candidatus Aenigmarchaeota archaeon]|nr:hypothetical protein [Candidatus Aenigmarchaeota archaeon]